MFKNTTVCVIFATLLFSSIPFAALAQTEAEIQKILSTYDLPKLKQMEQAFAKRYTKEKKYALDFAKKNNLPLLLKDAQGNVSRELQTIDANGNPIYFQSHNTIAGICTRTNLLYTDGGLGLDLMGQNMTAYVWDIGHPRITHVDYDGPGGENRASIEDAVAEGGVTMHPHSATVTGITIGAALNDSRYKGMAHYARSKNYIWNNDLAEITAAAANGMLVSNQSYGITLSPASPHVPGCYLQIAADYDNVMFNAPYYQMVCSAGNDGVGSAYDLIAGGRQTSKNGITVANAIDATIDEFGGLVSNSIYSSSSTGPTDELRIKPDITGNGYSTGGTVVSDDYSTMEYPSGGTSFAAPNISGSLLLLQQHYNNLNGNFMRAATLKGLALHTADDLEIQGPDAKAGWGLMNAKTAAQTISRKGTRAIISELTLAQGQSYSVTVTADGINKLMASLSWTDAPGTPTNELNSPLSRLVNDLDIRITKAATTYFPYKLLTQSTNGLGDNTVDPYERIDVNNATGNYTITITHKGNLNSGTQNFSLIVTGITVACTVSIPNDLVVSNITSTAATLKWNNAVDNFYTVRYRAVGAGSWLTQICSEKQLRLTGLTAFTNYEVQINSFCPGGSSSDYSFITYFTTSGNYCSSYSTNLYNGGIQIVELGSMYHFSEYYEGQGYQNTTNNTINLIKGESNAISIRAFPDMSGPCGYAVWIDYNRNGVFTDSGELVFSRSNTSNSIITGSFTVPQTALLGSTRMRISQKGGAIPGSCDTNFATGEVEDYTVNIKASACSGQTTWNGTAWSNGFPNTNLQAIISGNYSGNGFTACQLDVTGTAQVNLNSNLIVEGAIAVAATANLTIASNANILQSKNIANTGKITISKTTSPLKRMDYVLWSSPVSGQNLQNFSPQTLSNRFYSYNSASNLYSSINPASHSFTSANACLIRMPNNHPSTPTIWTGTFTGIPNNGNITITVPMYSYVAIGNPYPSALDTYPLIIDNELYYEPLYFWRKENNTLSSSYATFTPGLGGIANAGDPNHLVPTRYVNVGQGFIVKTDFLNSITFKNNMRLIKKNNLLLREMEELSEGEKSKIFLNVTNNADFSSNAMVAYLAGATTGIDAMIDGRYINDSQNALTSLINNEEFTLQGRGLPFDVTDEVPLGFKTEIPGNYTFKMISANGIFATDQQVFLKDLENNITHNLKHGNYEFATDTGVFNNRFKLVFQDELLSVISHNSEKIGVYVKNHQAFIKTHKSKIESVVLYDLSGRKIAQKETVDSFETTIDLSAFANQLFVIKVETVDGQSHAVKVAH